jgi:hypothetical protein
MFTGLQGLLRTCGYIALVAAGLGALTAASTGPARAAEKTFTCTPVNVAVFPKSRVHVRCSPGDGAIEYFALGLSSQDDANRALSIAATALTAKRNLIIWYDPSDLSGAGIGCLNANCRLIGGIEIF